MRDGYDRQYGTIMLELLEAVAVGGVRTQRHLAFDLGVAVGLVNLYLKRCVNKGLIKVSAVPTRRFAYYLTPQGFAEKSQLTVDYLSQSFFFFVARVRIARRRWLRSSAPATRAWCWSARRNWRR